MSFTDKIVATEADAIHALALVRAGVSVTASQMDTVTDWCSWELSNLKDAVAALVPGQAANTQIQTDLAAAQVALNAAGSQALSAHDRYVATVKARVAVSTLALDTVG